MISEKIVAASSGVFEATKSRAEYFARYHVWERHLLFDRLTQ